MTPKFKSELVDFSTRRLVAFSTRRNACDGFHSLEWVHHHASTTFLDIRGSKYSFSGPEKHRSDRRMTFK